MKNSEIHRSTDVSFQPYYFLSENRYTRQSILHPSKSVMITGYLVVSVLVINLHSFCYDISELLEYAVFM